MVPFQNVLYQRIQEFSRVWREGRLQCPVSPTPQPQGIHLLAREGAEKGEDTAITFIR